MVVVVAVVVVVVVVCMLMVVGSGLVVLFVLLLLLVVVVVVGREVVYTVPYRGRGYDVRGWLVGWLDIYISRRDIYETEGQG